jgi:dethiobiotin synthetase
MRGLFVAGVAHGALEQEAAETIAAQLARAGEPAETVPAVVPAVPASPLTGARHQGDRIEPAPLVEHVRSAADGRTAVVTAGGGLLAPLTPRYSVRDLARELGLPVVLVAAPTADTVNVVRLSLEAARVAGLAVAGVILTGWPDRPTRVQLDERGLLEELATAPVAVLPSGAAREDALRRWPDVTQWPDTAPAPPAVPAEEQEPGPPAPQLDLALDAYRAWEGGPQGDPRATPRPRLMQAMLDIIEAEGPVLAYRAYSVYNRASGGKKLTSIARAPLSSAVYWLAREGRIVLTRKDDIPWQDDDLLRTPDTAGVRVRELGPRALEEVPLDEIAELMQRARSAGVADPAALKRAVLDAYGLKRLTARADEYLGLAVGLLDG